MVVSFVVVVAAILFARFCRFCADAIVELLAGLSTRRLLVPLEISGASAHQRGEVVVVVDGRSGH